MSRKPWKSDAKRTIKQHLLTVHGSNCAYCGCQLDIESCTIDHVNAKGSNGMENLLPACMECNTTKRAATLEEFRSIRQYQQVGKMSGTPSHYTCRHIKWLLCQPWFPYALDHYAFHFEKAKGGK